jgi:hypothetical protein
VEITLLNRPRGILWLKIQTGLFVDAKNKHDPVKSGKEFVKI